jgi:hypothetical protein
VRHLRIKLITFSLVGLLVALIVGWYLSISPAKAFLGKKIEWIGLQLTDPIWWGSFPNAPRWCSPPEGWFQGCDVGGEAAEQIVTALRGQTKSRYIGWLPPNLRNPHYTLYVEFHDGSCLYLQAYPKMPEGSFIGAFGKKLPEFRGPCGADSFSVFLYQNPDLATAVQKLRAR